MQNIPLGPKGAAKFKAIFPNVAEAAAFPANPAWMENIVQKAEDGAQLLGAAQSAAMIAGRVKDKAAATHFGLFLVNGYRRFAVWAEPQMQTIKA